MKEDLEKCGETFGKCLKVMYESGLPGCHRFDPTWLKRLIAQTRLQVGNRKRPIMNRAPQLTVEECSLLMRIVEIERELSRHEPLLDMLERGEIGQAEIEMFRDYFIHLNQIAQNLNLLPHPEEVDRSYFLVTYSQWLTEQMSLMIDSYGGAVKPQLLQSIRGDAEGVEGRLPLQEMKTIFVTMHRMKQLHDSLIDNLQIIAERLASGQPLPGLLLKL